MGEVRGCGWMWIGHGGQGERHRCEWAVMYVTVNTGDAGIPDFVASSLFASSTRRLVAPSYSTLLESIYAELNCTCAWSLQHCIPYVAFTPPPRPRPPGLDAWLPPRRHAPLVVLVRNSVSRVFFGYSVTFVPVTTLSFL